MQIDGLEVDLGRLPPELQDLAPAIERWAATDPDERDQRLEQAATDDLAQFWLAVSPQLPAINAYLEEQAAGEQSNEAVVLAAMAEAALEASQVIERRTGGAAR